MLEPLRSAVEHRQRIWIGVRTRLEEGQIGVEIEDRGTGFEPVGPDALPGRRGGLGPCSVGERLRMLQGTMKIRSSPGSGTLVTLALPREREAA